MELEIIDIVIAGVIVFMAGMAQSAVGFGFALFATPVLIWIGIPLPNVIALISTCSGLQAMIGAKKLHAELPWKLSFIATSVRVISVLIGVFFLRKLVDQSVDMIRIVVGTILCILMIIQMLWKPRVVTKMHWGWGGLAFSASGILAGICGMGGPPLVLWAMAHDWSAKKTRGFLFGVFTISIPIQIGILLLTFGSSILWSILLGVAFFPIVFLGASIGLPIGDRMDKAKLKRLAFIILTVIGISAVISGVLALINK